MNETSQWLAQWPIWALVALLVSAVFYAGRLAQRVGGLEQGQADLKAGLGRLETRMDTRLEALATRMEALFGELRDELRTIARDQATVRERVSVLEASRQRPDD